MIYEALIVVTLTYVIYRGTKAVLRDCLKASRGSSRISLLAWSIPSGLAILASFFWGLALISRYFIKRT